jgi:hypothetical protein
MSTSSHSFFIASGGKIEVVVLIILQLVELHIGCFSAAGISKLEFSIHIPS